MRSAYTLVVESPSPTVAPQDNSGASGHHGVGTRVGVQVGYMVGNEVGYIVGIKVGELDGTGVGDTVGSDVGCPLG